MIISVSDVYQTNYMIIFVSLVYQTSGYFWVWWVDESLVWNSSDYNGLEEIYVVSIILIRVFEKSKNTNIFFSTRLVRLVVLRVL